MPPKQSSAYDFDYDYEYSSYKSSAVRPLELPSDYETKRKGSHLDTKKDLRKKQKQNRKPKTSTFRIAISLLFCFSVAMLLVVRTAYIAEINYSIEKLNNEYEDSLKINKEVSVSLMKSVNLDALEGKAIEEMSMQYPDVQTQITYVPVEVKDIIDNRDLRGYHDVSEVKEGKAIVFIKQILVGFSGNVKNN